MSSVPCAHRLGPLPLLAFGPRRVGLTLGAGLGRPALVTGLAAIAVLALVANAPHGQGAELFTWLLMAPLCEEAFFRGLLHEALLRRWGDSVCARLVIANALVALAFAALHAATRGVATGLAVILPALLIGQAYGRSRRLLPVMALHASFNLAWLAWGRPGATALAVDAQNFLSILQEWFA